MLTAGVLLTVMAGVAVLTAGDPDATTSAWETTVAGGTVLEDPNQQTVDDCKVTKQEFDALVNYYGSIRSVIRKIVERRYASDAAYRQYTDEHDFQLNNMESARAKYIIGVYSRRFPHYLNLMTSGQRLKVGSSFADRWNSHEIADNDVPDTTTSTVASFAALAATAGVEHHKSEFTKCFSFYEFYKRNL